MTEFLTSVKEIVSGIIEMLGTVTTGLLSNNLFQLGLGIMITTILIGVVSKLVRRGRR